MDGVVLLGFMGAGKTSVGTALAAGLGVPFVDLDARLAETHGPIPEQFVAVGESGFRRREAAAVAEWVEAGAVGVLALGGGAWQVPAVREALWGRCRTVFLDVPLEQAHTRVGGGDGRPLWDAGVAQRFADRQPVYRTADHTVDATGTVEEVVARVMLALQEPHTTEPRAVHVGTGVPYHVWVAPGFAGLGKAVRDVLPSVEEGVVLVSDSEVEPRWARAVERELRVARRVVVPAGETHKGWESLQAVLDGVLEGEAHRGTVVVALGGGVVGDVAGLAAALALRGIPVVQLPTTLLAMVDASVGGKTAINHHRGKNLVGAFHQPRLVWAATQTLGTLPEEERLAGWGEVVKTALIGDPELLDTVGPAEEAARAGDLDPMIDIVLRCVAVKGRVVADDALERGDRLWLNAGHTVAHGVETALGHGAVPHGRAVALGLVAELRWAIAEGHCVELGLLERLEAALRACGVDLDLPSFDRAAALQAMGHDKKGTASAVRVPVPRRAGEMVVIDVPRERLGELLPG